MADNDPMQKDDVDMQVLENRLSASRIWPIGLHEKYETVKKFFTRTFLRGLRISLLRTWKTNLKHASLPTHLVVEI